MKISKKTCLMVVLALVVLNSAFTNKSEPLTNSYIVLPIDSEKIYTSNKVWTQPEDCSSYMISVLNKKSEPMKCTVKYGDNKFYSFTVMPHKTSDISVNDAFEGEHTISFSTDSGYVAGIVTVAVSNSKL